MDIITPSAGRRFAFKGHKARGARKYKGFWQKYDHGAAAAGWRFLPKPEGKPFISAKAARVALPLTGKTQPLQQCRETDNF
jgi:hypothetical protein